jgi:hypothetical protein
MNNIEKQEVQQSEFQNQLCHLPQDGIWLVKLAKIALDISIAVSVALYIPALSIILMTMHMLSHLKTSRQMTMGLIPSIWSANFLTYNIAEGAMFVTYLSVRKLTNQFLNAVIKKIDERNKLCDFHLISL